MTASSTTTEGAISMSIIICRDCQVQVPGDIDSLRLIHLRDQHALCPTNEATRILLLEHI